MTLDEVQEKLASAVRRWLLAAGLLLIASAPSAGQACSYSQVPEPVGHASAEFFAKRMAGAATFVDVAVAEGTQPAFGARKEWPVPSTSFRVVFRLKGKSPDRFSLFVGALPAGEPIPEAKHFVDDEGRVSPFPYPRETNPQAPYIGSSCDPGMLSVRPGQAYVIFREADGRLLGRVPMLEGREEVAFPIMPVELDEPFGWLQAAGAATAGHDASQDRRPSWDLVAVRFKSGLSAQEAERWARAASVRPVAVISARGKVIEESRVPIGNASTGLIAYAMRSAGEGHRYLRGLAAQLLDETEERLELDTLLPLHANLLFQSAAVEPGGNVPARVVAMEVTGTPEALTRLERMPQIAEIQSGYVFRGRTGAAPVVEPAAPARPNVGVEQRETGRSLRARLQAFAQGRPLPTPQMIPPTPPVDPFSYTGCIRFGDTEAVALKLPLMARFREFTLYASPEAADCTQTAEALTCRLAPRSAVRLDVGNRIGGFRVGPDTARFEVRGNSIMCGRESEPGGAS